MFRILYVFFFQAEDGIRDLVRSRGLGDVYKRQLKSPTGTWMSFSYLRDQFEVLLQNIAGETLLYNYCLLYTSDAADDLLCVDLGGRRIIKKKQ